MRVVFMGTAPFAVPSLTAIAAAGHRIVGVVTQPDRPRGRGNRLSPSAVKSAAEQAGIRCLQPEKASDPSFIAAVADLDPEVIAVVAYGQILRLTLLQVPPLGCVNLHASLLPELRGAAPIQWALIRGMTTTGLTTIFMDPGMDTGDIILQEQVDILPGENAGALAGRLGPLGARLLVRSLGGIESGSAPRIPQDHARATSAPPLRQADAEIDWAQPAPAVVARIRGCNPAPGAFTWRGAEVLKLWEAEVSPVAGGPGTGAPGKVFLGAGGELLVATEKGCVQLLEVQPQSRARMPASAYVRGHPLQCGEVLGASTLARPG